jgi:hypothetical protein
MDYRWDDRSADLPITEHPVHGSRIAFGFRDDVETRTNPYRPKRAGRVMLARALVRRVRLPNDPSILQTR